ncbi:DUF6188 family protein [Streptomyces sp. AF1A]|jgi:hypothetical protein|uniref:DUF6188 family protein n=1 Tax=Streptomyces sp. AF1A TaxID=3394350 RepID=UPI0039BD38AC
MNTMKNMDHMLSVLTGSRVEDTSCDSRVRLGFAASCGSETQPVTTELILETVFRLRNADGEHHEVYPGSGSAVAPVLDLYGQSVRSVRVQADASIAIVFDAGSALWIGPDAQFSLSTAMRTCACAAE